jgi:hypothetical protein
MTPAIHARINIDGLTGTAFLGKTCPPVYYLGVTDIISFFFGVADTLLLRIWQ